jgi:regulator of sigma E protease
MTNILINALTYIVAISILVAVHEFGHFWVARRLGIKTLRFSIGFGRVLWSRFGKDGTEYAISAIPLGGYVRMLDERDAEVASQDFSRAFNRQPVWKRVAVLFAGPGFNFLFAIAAYWVLFLTGVPEVTPVVGEVKPNSIAAGAGLRSDDRILAVAGRDTPTRQVALLEILDAVLDDGIVDLRVVGKDGATRTVELVVTGRGRELTEPNALFPGLGFDFWYPQSPAVLGEIKVDGAAAKAGLRKGDRVLQLDGQTVATFEQMSKLIAARPGSEVALEIMRDTERLSISALLSKEVDASGKQVGRLGVGVGGERVPFPEEMRVMHKEAFFPALASAGVETWNKVNFTFKMVWKLVSGQVSIKSISGPIGIATVAGTAMQYGFFVFLNLLALISISIGALNLLPVPILDGGQIVYQLVELLKGGPVSERAQLLGQQVGIVLLGLLMILALFNDIAPHVS